MKYMKGDIVEVINHRSKELIGDRYRVISHGVQWHNGFKPRDIELECEPDPIYPLHKFVVYPSQIRLYHRRFIDHVRALFMIDALHRRFRSLFPQRRLVAYNHGRRDCPALRVGDTIITVLENDPLDYIAGLCGMSMRMAKKGDRVKWRVKEVLENGSVLCTSGSNRFNMAYLTWSDGNRVTIKSDLAHSEMLIRVYLLLP